MSPSPRFVYAVLALGWLSSTAWAQANDTEKLPGFNQPIDILGAVGLENPYT
jgi:hypothetical protein